MAFYNLSKQQTLATLESSMNGLSHAEALRRQKKYGPNRIKVRSQPLWRKILEPFLDIFMLVLIGAVLLSLWQGELIDAIIIGCVIGASAIIFYVQRFSTDRVLRSLSKHSAQTVLTLRSSTDIGIDSSKLVPGDIVRLAEGEKVPADIRLLDCANFRVNESQLTGESLPIEKQETTLGGEVEIYEQANMAFQGSFVVSGTATGVVVATGNATEFGSIASLSTQQSQSNPIQKKIDRLIAKIIAAVGAISLVAFVLAQARGMELFESLRFVMALAVSAVPEGLPIAISVVLVLGMRRMAARRALVRQMRSIETIGAITTIATDKTGTLTKNKLSVGQVWAPSSGSQIDEVVARVANRKKTTSHDPLDLALDEYARKKRIVPRQSPVEELPFDQDMSMSATVWHDGGSFDVYIKGAPERVLESCKLGKEELKQAKEAIDDMAQEGFRVIGLASLKSPKKVESFAQLKSARLKFEGLVAVADVLRPEASRAIRAAERAGVSVRMITGDHFETAYQIGRQLKMVESRSEVFDCRQMSKMSDQELEKVVKDTKVFSRVIPEQKYRLLSALKKNNITAMTGDGVNDVPALSNAHVGVAMGSGSQIAKDAGDIILLDDNFKTIIDAMREGRIMIANVRKMLFYLLSTNIGETITMLGALAIGIRMPLEPVQILWINLVTDTTMVIPLGLEPGEKDVMKQPPSSPKAPILRRAMVWRMIMVALLMALMSVAIYLVLERSHGHAYAQTLVFMALVVSQWANAFNSRSDHESVFKRLKVVNRSFYMGLLISLSMQLLVFFGPLGAVMHVVDVHWMHMLVISAAAFVAPILLVEIHKALLNRKNKLAS